MSKNETIGSFLYSFYWPLIFYFNSYGHKYFNMDVS